MPDLAQQDAKPNPWRTNTEITLNAQNGIVNDDAQLSSTRLMLRLNNLTFERGDDVLFSGLDAVVYPGQRMAVVGRNGVGKSTLFKLVLGELEGSAGEVDFPDDWRVGHMLSLIHI